MSNPCCPPSAMEREQETEQENSQSVVKEVIKESVTPTPNPAATAPEPTPTPAPTPAPYKPTVQPLSADPQRYYREYMNSRQPAPTENKTVDRYAGDVFKPEAKDKQNQQIDPSKQPPPNQTGLQKYNSEMEDFLKNHKGTEAEAKAHEDKLRAKYGIKESDMTGGIGRPVRPGSGGNSRDKLIQEGWKPPTGPSFSAMVTWVNQKTGETKRVGSGGYTPPSDDWKVSNGPGSSSPGKGPSEPGDKSELKRPGVGEPANRDYQLQRLQKELDGTMRKDPKTGEPVNQKVVERIENEMKKITNMPEQEFQDLYQLRDYGLDFYKRQVTGSGKPSGNSKITRQPPSPNSAGQAARFAGDKLKDSAKLEAFRTRLFN